METVGEIRGNQELADKIKNTKGYMAFNPISKFDETGWYKLIDTSTIVGDRDWDFETGSTVLLFVHLYKQEIDTCPLQLSTPPSELETELFKEWADKNHDFDYKMVIDGYKEGTNDMMGKATIERKRKALNEKWRKRRESKND